MDSLPPTGEVLTRSEEWKTEKVRENRLRRMAQRQSVVLRKSRRRDPRASDFGGYMIVNSCNGVAGGPNNAFTMSLDDVERWLTQGSERTHG